MVDDRARCGEIQFVDYHQSATQTIRLAARIYYQSYGDWNSPMLLRMSGPLAYRAFGRLLALQEGDAPLRRAQQAMRAIQGAGGDAAQALARVVGCLGGSAAAHPLVDGLTLPQSAALCVEHGDKDVAWGYAVDAARRMTEVERAFVAEHLRAACGDARVVSCKVLADMYARQTRHAKRARAEAMEGA